MYEYELYNVFVLFFFQFLFSTAARIFHLSVLQIKFFLFFFFMCSLMNRKNRVSERPLRNKVSLTLLVGLPIATDTSRNIRLSAKRLNINSIYSHSRSPASSGAGSIGHVIRCR